MNEATQPDLAPVTPECRAFEQAQRAADLALQVCREHPDDPDTWKAWEALGSARALMRGAYAADEFLYAARAATCTAIQRGLGASFDVAWKYHHPVPGRGAWDRHAQDLPAVGAWHAATQSFHAAEEAAYPPRFWDDLEQLRQGDSARLETAVRFLEADPWFFRSGYVKEYVIRSINRCELSDAQAARLRQVVWAAIEGRGRREFRRYCRLARRVADDELRAGLREVLQPWDGAIESLLNGRWRAQSDTRFRRHASWVLSYLTDGGKAGVNDESRHRMTLGRWRSQSRRRPMVNRTAGAE